MFSLLYELTGKIDVGTYKFLICDIPICGEDVFVSGT